MKRGFTFLAVFLSVFVFTGFQEPEVIYPYYPNFSINKGEVLEFSVSYAFFTVGKARLVVGDTIHKINNRYCYKIDLQGKTSGAVDWVAKVDDVWGAYVDTAAILPHVAYRNIAENNYRKNERVRFDHETNMVEAKVLNHKNEKYRKPKYYHAPDNVRDLVSGYFYFRGLDFTNYQINDTLKIDAFFEDTVYNFKVLYKGPDIVETKIGNINALMFVPIMPDNQLFDGENSITAWFSDDLNKIPLKVEASMFIGSAGVEITKVKNVKHPINFVK